MRDLSLFPASVAQGLEAVFTDIDDTITTDGRIPAQAFSAIWRAHEAGLSVVLVTGRPAGWCDHLARMWPVAGVVGENGALAFAMKGGRLERIYSPRPDGAAERLEVIRQEVLQGVPGAKVAADQAYREYDLAIDFCEEVEPLGEHEVDRIVEVFHRHGANAKVSSIHVNGWFGEFDKLTMCRRFSREMLGQELDLQRAVYIGDSPNDEPMFSAFPHACGVANLRRFTSRMKHLPAYLAGKKGGQGFAQILETILSLRAAG